MRKYFIILSSALALYAESLTAQTPANRATQTVIADVLAQMPAHQQTDYNRLMHELTATGEEGVLSLLKRFDPSGKGNNIAVYMLSAVPLGGYVKMLGEDNDAEIDSEERSRSFSHKAAWQRFLVVFAGPFFNLFFAVLLYFGLFALVGVPQVEPAEGGLVGQVLAGSPAERAGIRAGDLILAIDGQKITTWEQITGQVQKAGGRALHLDIRRGEKKVALQVIPELLPERNMLGEDLGPKRYMLGLMHGWNESYVKRPLGFCAVSALSYTWNLTSLNLLILGKMLQGKVPANELGGPIRIAEFAGERMQAGIRKFVDFVALVSIGLGVLNLLPVPVLDGGHLAFLSFEMLRGKPASERVMEIGQKIGMTLLVALMVFVFYNDIARLVQRWLIR